MALFKWGLLDCFESQTGLWSNGFDWPKHWLIFKYVGDADVCKFRIPFRVGGSKSSYYDLGRFPSRSAISGHHADMQVVF